MTGTLNVVVNMTVTVTATANSDPLDMGWTGRMNGTTDTDLAGDTPQLAAPAEAAAGVVVVTEVRTETVGVHVVVAEAEHQPGGVQPVEGIEVDQKVGIGATLFESTEVAAEIADVNRNQKESASEKKTELGKRNTIGREIGTAGEVQGETKVLSVIPRRDVHQWTLLSSSRELRKYRTGLT